MGEAVPIKNNIGVGVQFSLKTNLHIWTLHSSNEFKSHIRSELARSKNTVVEYISLSAVSEEGLSSFHEPDIIIVEASEDWADKVADLQKYNLPFGENEVSLLVFGDDNDSGNLKLALKLGAADYYFRHAEIEVFVPFLREIAEHKIANRKMGELLLFMNAKGGNGASTLALNSAVELAEKFPNQVLLIDIDTQFGLLNEYLDISPKYGLVEAIETLQDMDEASISSLVTKYGGKLHTIGFTRGQGSIAIAKSTDVQKLIPMLRQYYKYVIIDFSRGIDPIFSPLVTPATKIFLVLQQNYMSLKNTSHLVKSLKLEFGVVTDSLSIVINRFDKGQSISIKDVETTVPNIKVDVIPNDFKNANESANLGKPVVEYRRKSAIGKAIHKLCSDLMPEETNQKGWLARLFS